MELKNDLKEFVQIIQNKICIAVAIAVIRSKPSHLSARKYAEEIQERCMQDWVQKVETSVFDDKILEIQQDKIFDQITDLVNPASTSFSSPQSNCSDVEVYKGDFCSELALSEEWGSVSLSDFSDSESDEATGVQSQANFMKAMVQLKFVVESFKAIPRDKVYSCLYDNALKKDSIRTSQEVVKNNIHSEDSGFGDNSVPQESNLIPSSIFRYLTHSYRTEALVHKCISSLLSFTEDSFVNRPTECFKYWKGSVLEHLASVLKEVSSNPICSESLSNFITRTLENIWSIEEINMLTACDYQIKMLTEFCCNKYVCESVINFLMAKMTLLSAKLSEGNFYCPEKLCDIHLIEKMPLFITLLESVLIKWKEASSTPALAPKVEQIERNVTQLWKKKWCDAEEKTNTKGLEGPTILREWKCICDKLITTSAEQFPLISFSLCEISDYISTLIQDN